MSIFINKGKDILRDKEKGLSDEELGKKYNVSLKYIERLIVKEKGVNISRLNKIKKIVRFEPENFQEEKTSVWSFKQRGDWATHTGNYRGNWSPYVPRNVILKYSSPGDLVLDYFCGSGTTAIECKLLGRKCIAIDINDKAIELAKENLNFNIPPTLFSNKFEVYEPELIVGDARDLSFIKDNSVDLICSHPPYANIIHYTDGKSGDLSFLDIDDFLSEMQKVAKESFRVLKPGKKCAILIGDIRRKKYIVPLGFKLIDVYLKEGFELYELVIKRQHNCKTTGFWYEKSLKQNFLLLAHEYLAIFEKPLKEENKKETAKNNFEFITKELKLTPDLPEKFETTSVWILPSDDFDKRLNANVLLRYSQGNYMVLDFSIDKNKFQEENIKQSGQLDLLFIKSSFLSEIHVSKSMVEKFLDELKKLVYHKLPFVKDGGYLVVQVKDVRIGRYIEPIAKRVIDTLSTNSLKIKEIVIAVPDVSIYSENNSEYLSIVHQYLLIYEVRR
jgi:DNA modification methylase